MWESLLPSGTFFSDRESIRAEKKKKGKEKKEAGQKSRTHLQYSPPRRRGSRKISSRTQVPHKKAACSFAFSFFPPFLFMGNFLSDPVFPSLFPRLLQTISHIPHIRSAYFFLFSPLSQISSKNKIAVPGFWLSVPECR